MDVEVLTADHAQRRLRQLAAHICGPVGSGLAKRLRQQRVAGEDGVRLAEARPCAGAASPHLVVVESRQVVVDERERMDELQRSRRREDVLDVGTGRLSRCQADHGPHAFAARLEPVADRLGEVAELRHELQACEVLLDELPELRRRLH